MNLQLFLDFLLKAFETRGGVGITIVVCVSMMLWLNNSLFIAPLVQPVASIAQKVDRMLTILERNQAKALATYDEQKAQTTRKAI